MVETMGSNPGFGPAGLQREVQDESLDSAWSKRRVFHLAPTVARPVAALETSLCLAVGLQIGLGRGRVGRKNFFATCDFFGPVGADMGMVRIFLFLLAGTSVAVGSLTVFWSPDWQNWKLALLAGEYGHWAAPVALGGAVSAMRAGHSGWAGSAVTPSLIAAGLLLKPTGRRRRSDACCRSSWRRRLAEPRRSGQRFRCQDSLSRPRRRWRRDAGVRARIAAGFLSGGGRDGHG